MYQTRELAREEAARARRRAKKVSQGQPVPPPTGPIQKLFNLLTYKLHALGDYVYHIVRFGTTDSYSTQTVSNLTIYLAVATLTYFRRVSLSIAVSSDTTHA